MPCSSQARLHDAWLHGRTPNRGQTIVSNTVAVNHIQLTHTSCLDFAILVVFLFVTAVHTAGTVASGDSLPCGPARVSLRRLSKIINADVHQFTGTIVSFEVEEC